MSWGRPRTPIPTRSFEQLLELEQHYRDLASAAPLTQTKHGKHWPRWERWCESRGLNPYEADHTDVIEFVQESFDASSHKSTYNTYLAAVRWFRVRSGVPDPTTHPDVKAAVEARVVAAANKPRAETTSARALTAGETVSALTAPEPAPSPRATLLRTLLLISGGLGRRFTDTEMLEVPRDEVRVHAGSLEFGSLGNLTHTDDRMTCPVCAWTALDSSAPKDRPLALGQLQVTTSGEWQVGDERVASELAVNALRAAIRQCLGDADGFELHDPVGATIDAEDLRRIWVLLDLALAKHYRDSAVIALQVWGGFRSSDIARLVLGGVQDAPEGLLLHLAWQKNDQYRQGQTRAIPVLPERGDLCGATAIRRWLWLTSSRLNSPNCPVIPRVTKYCALPPLLRPYDVDNQPDNTSLVLSQPLKRRLRATGVNPLRVASHSGRKTLTTLAVQGGASLRDVRDHLGQRSEDTTYRHYYDTGPLDLADPSSAPGTMSWEDER